VAETGGRDDSALWASPSGAAFTAFRRSSACCAGFGRTREGSHPARSAITKALLGAGLFVMAERETAKIRCKYLIINGVVLLTPCFLRHYEVHFTSCCFMLSNPISSLMIRSRQRKGERHAPQSQKKCPLQRSAGWAVQSERTARPITPSTPLAVFPVWCSRLRPQAARPGYCARRWARNAGPSA